MSVKVLMSLSNTSSVLNSPCLLSDDYYYFDYKHALLCIVVYLYYPFYASPQLMLLHMGYHEQSIV